MESVGRCEMDGVKPNTYSQRWTNTPVKLRQRGINLIV